MPITKDTPTSDIIHDFVHSDNPKFKGKSKKERIKMALGAAYGMKKEDAPANSAGAGGVAGIGVGPQGEPPVSVKTQRKIQKRQKSTPTSVVLGYLRRKAPVIAESEADDARYGSNITINGKNMGRMNDPNNPNKNTIDSVRQSARDAAGNSGYGSSNNSGLNKPGAEVQRYQDKNWEESYIPEETFAGAAVFEVSSHVFHTAKMEKRKHKTWRKYLEEDDCLAEIREYANKNPGKPIILKNANTGEMTHARYGRGCK